MNEEQILTDDEIVECAIVENCTSEEIKEYFEQQKAEIVYYTDGYYDSFMKK